MATPSRSLADDIRGRSDAELIDLVLARPDLARPAPADLTSLAARAGTRASVQRAVEALDRGHLQVLEAVVVAGDGADRDDLLRLVGSDDRATVDAIVTDLWRSALVWRGADGHHVVRTVPEVLGTSVAGLGAPMRELRPSSQPEHADPDRIRAVLAEAPDDSRTMLERMTWGPAFGVLPAAQPGRTTVRWLLENHLLVPVSTDRVALPREVGLVLREGRLHRSVELTPPAIEARAVSLVDAAAGGAASECLTHVDELAAAWGADPPRVLRAGGLSVRDLRVTQLSLDLDPEHTAFVVELAYAAGLVADDGEVVPVWAPTSEIDEWSSSEAGHRWATLALAWLGSTRAPHLVGRRSTGTGPANALGPDVQWPAIRAIRREVLRELASLEPGSAPDHASLRERLAWRRPNRSAAVLDEAVEAVLREAEWLGVTGRGALSDAGRALVAPFVPPVPGAGAGAGVGGKAGGASTSTGKRTGRARSDRGADITSDEQDTPTAEAVAESVAAAMSAHLPAPVDHILVQADLTAVAPGPLVGALGSFMRLAADVESRGGATVYRFTPESVRRALDAGWTAADFTETVRRSSRTPVPQPLEYLVSDVARKHGQTRIGGAAAYIRSDDEAVLDTMLASRDLAPLRLRRLAPTVLVSSADPRVLVDLLRDNGFAPVHEGQDGTVVHAETPRRRAGTRRRGPGPMVSPVDRPYTQSLVDGLRAAEATADQRRAEDESKAGPRIQAMDPVVTLSLLRDAVADRHGVWIGYSDGHGATSRHLIHPQKVEGGRVRATDESGHEKSFSVHRITGATTES
ncbi:helicase-associated domain-containing protein [Terrabacter carboxydivorans]|uniref:Helicase-associated domain-containing protein n=1 Tax=Terrabacter carboxydivorans TaxID=619730 RepID=A0ABN3KYX0_9MICO